MPSLRKPNSHQLVRQLPYTRETIVGAVWLATVRGRVEKGGPRRPQLVGIRNGVERHTHAVQRTRGDRKGDRWICAVINTRTTQCDHLPCSCEINALVNIARNRERAPSASVTSRHLHEPKILSNCTARCPMAPWVDLVHQRDPRTQFDPLASPILNPPGAAAREFGFASGQNITCFLVFSYLLF